MSDNPNNERDTESRSRQTNVADESDEVPLLGDQSQPEEENKERPMSGLASRIPSQEPQSDGPTMLSEDYLQQSHDCLLALVRILQGEGIYGRSVGQLFGLLSLIEATIEQENAILEALCEEFSEVERRELAMINLML